VDPRNGLVLPEKFGLPLDQSFETYQYLLMQKVEIQEICLRLHGGTTHDMWGDPNEGNGKGDGEGGNPGDNTGGQGSKGGTGNGRKVIDITFDGSAVNGMSADELMSQAHRVREQVKNALRQVYKSMGGIGRGTMPSGVEEWLEGYLADPIIPWWEIFSTRARASRPSKYQRSCSVPNRTLMALSEEEPRIIPMPGRIRDRVWNIFFMVDTSGSMSTESLEIAKSELQHMLAVEDGTEIRYMEGDAAIHTDIVLKRGDEIPKEVVGRGGTDFDAYFIHMKKYLDDSTKSPDLVIVYTDGYAPAIQSSNKFPPEIPVIWLVTPQHSENFSEGYGEIIVCDPVHNERRKDAA
jgi:predicted metal-dependent peptidase